MTNSYDPIAEQYKRSKLQPWRTYIECFTLMKLIGDPRGLTVLDVGCGEGFYTRMIRERGAARVSGIDLSHRMIELARTQEAQQRLGIEYVVGDARELPATRQFDLVIAAYVLNYAHDPQELQMMYNGLARCVRAGGRFVAVNCSPVLTFPDAPSYRKYGFETTVRGRWHEGVPITWTFYLDDGPFEVENYHLGATTHEAACRLAGFRKIRWHPAELSSEGLPGYDRSFWSAFLDHPPIAFIECAR